MVIASIRFWRAIREHIPDDPAWDDLCVRLRHEPPQARKRHMPWRLDLSPAEGAMLRDVMEHPPTPYVAFVVQHHRRDALAKERTT